MKPQPSPGKVYNIKTGNLHCLENSLMHLCEIFSVQIPTRHYNIRDWASGSLEMNPTQAHILNGPNLKNQAQP